MATATPSRSRKQTPPRVGFVSLGCPKALVDSERILTQLRAEGYETVAKYDKADVVVVNTCGFIDSAVAESLDAIGEALEENGKVIVTGCLGKGQKSHVIREKYPDVLSITAQHTAQPCHVRIGGRITIGDGIDERICLQRFAHKAVGHQAQRILKDHPGRELPIAHGAYHWRHGRQQRRHAGPRLIIAQPRLPGSGGANSNLERRERRDEALIGQQVDHESCHIVEVPHGLAELNANRQTIVIQRQKRPKGLTWRHLDGGYIEIC
jgi:hypothetical protein